MIARGPPCSVFAFAKLREIRSGDDSPTKVTMDPRTSPQDLQWTINTLCEARIFC